MRKHNTEFNLKNITLLASCWVIVGCSAVKKDEPLVTRAVAIPIAAAESCQNSFSSTVDTLSYESTKADIKVVRLTPDVGSEVSKATVIVADLIYRVNDYEPDKFTVVAQVNTTRPGDSTDGSFRNYPILPNASGALRFCFPLSHIWDLADVKWPLELRFLVIKKTDEISSLAVAMTEGISFISTNPAFAGRTNSEPEDYGKFLDLIHEYFVVIEITASECSDRFPALHHTIESSYRKWTEAHSNLNRNVDELHFRRTLQLTRGAKDIAINLRAARKKADEKMISAQSNEQLKVTCVSLATNLTGHAYDPEVRYANGIAIIREFAGASFHWD